MIYNHKDIFWYVLFATNGKASKICDYLKSANIEHSFPMCYKERKIKDSERKRISQQPLLGNLLFVKSSRNFLEPHLKELKLQLGIVSDLYYRDLGSRELIIVPEKQMSDFITITSNKQEKFIYLSNEEATVKKGTKIRITGGAFEGIEGIFMRIKGDRRVVISIPNLLSVATAFIPTCFIQVIE